MSGEQSLVSEPEANVAETVVSHKKTTAKSFVHSVAWNAAGDWMTQIVSWICFFIVVRLLTPSDYGMAAMAASIGPFVGYFSGSGIPRAIVTLRDLTEHQLAQLNTVGLLLGFGSFALAAALAEPLALFYKTPRVALVFIVGATGLIFNGIQTVSNGLLLKAMRFRTIALFGTASAITTSVLILLFAWLGWGYWALILGGIPGGIVRTILVMRTRRQTYAIPHWRDVERPIKFGSYVVFSLIAYSFYQNLDNITAGHFLGQTQLGFYAMAWSLAYVPLDKVTSLVTTVMPSYFAAIQDDLGAVRRQLVKLTEGVAFLMFPSCVGFGLVARELIPLALGPKWEGCVAPLEILSIYAAFRSIVALLPKVLTAVGKPRFVMWNDIATIFVLGVAFYIGSHWGITGIAWGWVLAYPLVVIPLYYKVFVTIQMNVWDYFSCLRSAFEGTIVMILAVVLVKHALANQHSLLLRVCLEVVTGVIFYAATLWLRHREQTLALIQLAKSFRRK